jgi:hypothetical protein
MGWSLWDVQTLDPHEYAVLVDMVKRTADER